MAAADIASSIADDALALQFQREEIEAQRARQTGKWVEGSRPDSVLALDAFEAELVKAAVLLEDIRLAHSIALAVGLDAVADESEPRAIDAADAASDTTVVGPSVPYATRQRDGLEQLPQLKVDCTVCAESVHPVLTVRLACGDVYCKPCLKVFLMRVMHDGGPLPPRCCREPIDFSLVEAELSAEELVEYRAAEAEFSSTNPVYCADLGCAKFIPSVQRTRDIAHCVACGADTCLHCKALAHHGSACREDEEGQRFIRFAHDHGWQECYGCGRVCSRDSGCDHITCRCRAEFCYRCGVRWKNCPCGDWAPELLNRRAQEVVDRQAEVPLAPAVRRHRVELMEQELLETHECSHSGRFHKVWLDGRQGRACEVCGKKHREYLLSCRHCHMEMCQDCRGHRV